jgi:chromosome segregation ATPase
VIIGTWWFNDPMTEGLLQVFPPIEGALSFGNEVSTDLSEFISNVQTDLEETTDQRAVASTLQEETQRADTYITIATAAFDTVEQVALALAEAGPGAPRLSNAANQVLETLDAAERSIEAIQSLSEQIASGRSDRLNALNDQLDTLQVNLTEINTAITETETNVADVKSKLPRWIDTGAIIVTLVFLWFGAAQFLLLRSSWRFLRGG